MPFVRRAHRTPDAAPVRLDTSGQFTALSGGLPPRFSSGPVVISLPACETAFHEVDVAVSTKSRIVSNEALAQSEPHFVAPELVEVTSDGPRLIGGRCGACGALSFPKASVCSACLSEDLTATHLSAEGRLYSFAVVHQAPKGWTVPYTLGYVDLPEGIRVLAHIEGEPGMDRPVRLATGEVGTDTDGGALMSYVFATSSGDGK
jgi:uncharacterized OB-fold protein